MVAALGVTLGVAVYLFMNSLSAGFSGFSRGEIFKNNAHIKVYKADEISTPLAQDAHAESVILNPQITTLSQRLINPEMLLKEIKQQPFITHAITQVDVSAFYNRGNTQIKGTASGVNMDDYAAMFNTEKYMVAGSISALRGNLNGTIIGAGIAEKLNLSVDDNIAVSSSYAVTKVLRIVGIFSTGNSLTDNSKSYINTATAQQFLKEGPSYVTTIYANTPDPDKAAAYAEKLQAVVPYIVEDWKTTNADIVAGDKTRGTLMGAISLSILFVAAFGIYNILSETINQKINDIAILKAVGFKGRDVIQIFVAESIIMGCIGTILGLGLGAILISIMSGIYMGGPVGYFPIKFELHLFIRSLFLGILITCCAGFFPAKKAANVDPVSIFRK